MRTGAKATRENSAGGGLPTITGMFLAISDGLIAARNNPRTVGDARATGPPPEREEAPPEARQETPGGTKGGAMEGGEIRPCQYVTVRASGPCADLSQVASPLCTNMKGPGCDGGLRFCMAHASRVENTRRHGVDQGVVPARQAKPPGTTAARVEGATPLDLPRGKSMHCARFPRLPRGRCLTGPRRS